MTPDPQQLQPYVHEPSAVYRPQYLPEQRSAAYVQPRAVTYIEDLDRPGYMVAVPTEMVQRQEPTPPRDLTPRPFISIDPVAQRIAAGGVLLAGGGFLLNAITGTVILGLALVTVLVGMLKFGGSGGRRGGDTYFIEQRSGFLGRNSVHLERD